MQLFRFGSARRFATVFKTLCKIMSICSGRKSFQKNTNVRRSCKLGLCELSVGP